MLRTAKERGIALIVIGALGVLALTALGPVFAPEGASADRYHPSWQQTTEADRAGSNRVEATDVSDVDPDNRDAVLDMVREHMGVTGEDAEEWAETMGNMMQYMHGGDFDEMLDYCGEYAGAGPDGAAGPDASNWESSYGGMMGGGTMGGGTMGGGMMDGGMMDGGMMDGGMMGGWQ